MAVLDRCAHEVILNRQPVFPFGFEIIVIQGCEKRNLNRVFKFSGWTRNINIKKISRPRKEVLDLRSESELFGQQSYRRVNPQS